MKLVLCILFVLLICFSCNEEEEIDTISFDLKQDVQDIHTQQLFAGYQLVPLETNDSVLIGKIDKVVLWKDKLFVASFQKGQVVYAFDLRGHFLGKIGNQGRGPEEYIQLFDLFIDTVRNSLCFLSRVDQKLLEYDLNDFHLKKVRRLPRAFYRLYPWSGGFIGYMGNYTQDPKEPYNLWILDSSLHVVDKTLNIDEGWESKTLNIKNLSSYNDTVYYIAPADFNIYQYSGGSVKISHRVDFGEFQLPEKQISYEEYKKYSRQNYVTRLERFQELKGYYVYEVIVEGQLRLCFYNKETGCKNICKPSVYTDKYFLPFGNIIDIQQQFIISYIPATKMHELLQGSNGYVDYEKDYPEQIQRMRNDLPAISEDSNPCIVLWKWNVK